MNATSNDRCPLYMLGAPSHFRTEYRHEAAVVSREQDGRSGYLGRWLSMTTAMGVYTIPDPDKIATTGASHDN